MPSERRPPHFPGSRHLPIFLHVRKLYVSAEIIALESKTDALHIRGAFDAGFFHGVFQFLDPAGNGVGGVCDTVWFLGIELIISAFGGLHDIGPIPELSCIISASIRST